MRVRTGKTRRRRHKKVLNRTKGFRMTRSKLYKVAHESDMHAGQYAYNHRQRKQSQFRKIWISRITAASEANGIKYSTFMSKLKKADIELDRKVLADIAFNNPTTFTKLVESL
jgi:large subunit ribosomal protein L20